MRRWVSSLLALLLVFGCSLVFSLGAAADYLDIDMNLSLATSSSGISIPRGGSVSYPLCVEITFDPTSFKKQNLYSVNVGLTQSFSWRNSSGAIISQNGVSTKSGQTITQVSSKTPGLHVSFSDVTVFFYFDETFNYAPGVAVKITCNLSGYASVITTSASSPVAYALLYNGLSKNPEVPWDYNYAILSDDSESLKEAIDKQTEQDKQQHQETMDKIDDVTDFDEKEQGDLSGSVGDTQGQLEEKMGLLTWVGDLLSQFLDLFADPGGASLVFPGFSITVDGESYPVWADTPFDFQTIDDNFHALLVVVRFSTTVVVYGALVNYLGRVAEAVIHDRPVKEEGGSE